MITKSWRNNLKFGILGVFLGILIFQSALQVNSPMVFDKNLVEESFIDETTIPLDQGDYDLTKLPFLENTNPIVEWLENNITDESTLRESPNDPSYPLYYGESEANGSLISGDTNHYLEDFAVFLDSLFGLVAADDGENVIDYYNQLDDYGFQNSTEEGYYSYVNDGCTENSTVKEFMGNAQLILSLINSIENGIITKENAESIISNEWDALNSVFYDDNNDAEMYNRSTSDSQKYLEDQFVAAIIGMKLDTLDIYDSASVKAQNLMYWLTDDSDFYESDEFDIYRDVDTSSADAIGNYGRTLSTHAYAIWALIEWDLINSSTEANGIERAEAVYQKLNATVSNITTYSLFLNEWENDGDIRNDKIDLKDNALMMMAIKRLFEATGNMTYYNHLLQMHDSIQEYFLDSTYGNYFKSIQPGNTSNDDAKNLGSHAYLYRSLNALNELAGQTMLSLQLNSSDLEDGAQLIKGENLDLNITGRYYFVLPDYSDSDTNILNSTFYYSIRGEENVLIYNTTFNVNITGETSLIYDTSNLNTGIYTVSVMANYSGVATQFEDISFEIISGVEIDSISLESDSLYAGEQIELNLTLESVRVDSLDLIVNINGTTIQNQTFTTDEAVNETTTSLIYEISTYSNAEIGDTSLTVDIFDGDDLILSKDVSFSISSPVVIKEITSNLKTFKGDDLEVEIYFENLIESDIPVEISASGDYISFQTIAAHSVKPGLSSKTINISISENAPYGLIDFELNLLRASIDDLIKTQPLTVSVVNSLEFVSLISPEESYQGKESIVVLEMINHLAESQDIKIFINNVSQSESLIAGSNSIDFSFGNKFMSPYIFGTQGFTIRIEDAEGNLIYEEYIETQVKMSMGSILLGYVLPIIIPALGIVILKHLAMENKKRLS